MTGPDKVGGAEALLQEIEIVEVEVCPRGLVAIMVGYLL